MRPNELGNCSAGSYCPAGSAVWGLCPERYFCSVDGSTKTQCPDGYATVCCVLGAMLVVV